MLEQGLAGAELPLKDQTLPPEQDADDAVHSDHESDSDAEKADNIARDDDIDPAVDFAEEREGWRG